MHIKEIDKNIGIDVIQRYHYSKILPRLTRHYLGIFDDNEDFAGVVMLGWGTQPLQTLHKIFYNHIELKTKNYIEIGKMCFLPEYNGTRNFGSRTIKYLKKWLNENTTYDFLYTLADGIMGKCGFVYQASNFIYLGSFKTSVYRDVKTKEKIHPRSARKLCEENAEWANVKKIYWLTDDFCKYKGIDKINGLMFRYMMPLNKNAKRILSTYDEYGSLSNPKEKDLKFWIRTSKGKFQLMDSLPEFNMDVFTHNFQKY